MNQSDDKPIIFTQRAAEKAKQLVAARDHDARAGELLLRVFIQGGGCSGFQYGFDLDSAAEEDDLVVEQGGVRLVVDPMSYQYLVGAEIDYEESLMGAQFVVNNPNASSTCGCGMSFSP